MGEKDLRNLFIIAIKGIFIGTHETALTDRGRSLFFLQSDILTHTPQTLFAGRNRSGADKNDLPSAFT